MHQLTAVPGLTDSSDGVSPVAQSTAAAAIEDGQWSKNSMSWIAARITCVARSMRHLVCLPPGSTLQAKKSMKVNGVTDRSRQFSAVRTRSSIRPIVPGSKTYLVPSICQCTLFIHL
uniref:Uncharacterized protein n=1 Tax=Arundo donax TaxID=35708 RepID=A0A0A9D1U9_ARUDO